MSPPTKMVVPVALLLAFLSVGYVGYAHAAWREGFETARISWRNVENDAKHHVLQHQRRRDDAHTGNGCEWLRLEVNTGSRVFLAHDVARPRVIDDLVPSVWIKSDRPGLQLAARMVLPRTLDPRTGRPVSTIITGGGYTNVGSWQQLRLDGIPRLLTRKIRVLRMELGAGVDDREAYLDAVLLDVFGGQGVTNIWIDDLEVAGHVALNPLPSSPSKNVAASWKPEGAASLVPVRLPPIQDFKGGPPTLPQSAPRRTVKLVGSVLLVDSRPTFPRIIQHRGEPLKVLKQIGFNVIWLRRLPTPELLEEADRLGLWLICPPPRPVAMSTIADIGPQFDSILAWDLGTDLTEAEFDSTQRWAELIRAADRRGNRPLVCCPQVDLRGYSRLANLLLIDRRPLGTSLEMEDYATWVRQQPLLASLGTPIWTTVQTQPNEALRRQLTTLEPGHAPPLTVSPEQIRLLAYTAVASGSRGLVFVSDSPLDASDPETRQRATALELLNLELELLEPWAAAGSFVAAAESNMPEVSGAVLRTEHARLLLPIWSAPGSQCVPPQSATNALTLVAPGVPEASNAYELTAQGMQSLRHKRVTGGVSVTLDEFGLTTQVLLAHDPLVISAVHHRAARMGRRAAELQRHLAAYKWNDVQKVVGQLASRTPIKSAATWLATARKSLQTCDRQMASGDFSTAALNAQRTMRSLRLVERSYWDAAVEGLVEPITSPAALSFDTLPCHWRLMDRLAAGHFGPNRVAAGDFEDIGTMIRAGWRHIPNSDPAFQTAVDLVPTAARSGRLGLRLSVTAVDRENPPSVVENPPIQFTSPPVSVEVGQIVCIHGWVRVPTDIIGSTDGLLIVDSFTGEALADRIGPTGDWRQFALYRVAVESGPMCVTFALSGMGEAWLDDVAIQVL